MTNLCLTLAETSADSLQEKLLRYASRVPFIEVRLDYLSEISVPVLLEGKGTSFIATCRPLREGGRYERSEDSRLAVLEAAAAAGFDWIDLEHDVADAPVFPPGVQVIRSSHRFDDFPADLDSMMASLKERSADLYKAAIAVRSTSELVQFLSWMEKQVPEQRRVLIGMGALGQATRLLGGFLGNEWTYVVENESVAPGQFTLSDAENKYGLGSFSDCPSLYGLIGGGVVQTSLVSVFNKLFQEHRLNSLILPIELDDIHTWLEYARNSKLSFEGFSFVEQWQPEMFGSVTVTNGSGRIDALKKAGEGWLPLTLDREESFRPGALAFEERLSIKVEEEFEFFVGLRPKREMVVRLIRGE